MSYHPDFGYVFVDVTNSPRGAGFSYELPSGLVFVGATVDRRFRAFDAKTGEPLRVTDLPANG